MIHHRSYAHNYLARSWFLLRQTPREKPLPATVLSFELTAVQRHTTAAFKRAHRVEISSHLDRNERRFKILRDCAVVRKLDPSLEYYGTWRETTRWRLKIEFSLCVVVSSPQ